MTSMSGMTAQMPHSTKTRGHLVHGKRLAEHTGDKQVMKLKA